MAELLKRVTDSAFKAKPQLADEPRFVHHRLQGARAAVLAAFGQGTGTEALKPEECRELRSLALTWLSGWLASTHKHAQLFRAGPQFCASQLLKEPDLVSVRSEQALEKLDNAEQKAWQKFWSEVKQK